MSSAPSVRRSLGIVTITKLIAFGLGLPTMVLVSRLLSPHEIGIFSVSAAFIGFAHVLREFGVGQYLIQAASITRERRRAAFTVTLMVSWSIAGVLYVFRPFIAKFYEEPGIEQVMGLLAINFLILPFATPLRSQLQREMQFSKLAIADISNNVAAAVVTVGAAWFGMSYKSMALGAIAGNTVAFLALITISPRGALDWPTLSGLREVLKFGTHSSVASFSAEIGTAAPDLILGRTKGFSDVAYFSRANGLLSMALNELSGVVQSVIVPLFAKGHRDGRNLSELYVQYSASFLAIVLPVLGLLALLSDPLIDFMFGSQWARSAPLASMLCAFAMMTGPVRLAPLVLVASGHVATLMRCHLVLVTAKVAILFTSVFVSLEVVVASLAVVYLLEAVLFMRALRERIGVDAGALWRGIRTCYFLVPITLLLPALALLALHSVQIYSSFILLTVAGCLGIVSWIVGVFWLRHPVRLELINVAKKAGHFLGIQEKQG